MENSRGKQGFTLIEILLVIVIISILAGVIMGASTYITRVARIKRLEVTRAVLKTAIYRYHAEYNEWPVEVAEDEVGEETITREKEKNAEVFGALRRTNEARNPDGISFLDETTVLTYENGAPVALSTVGSGEKPLIYINREGKARDGKGAVNYFKVVFNLENDTAEVYAPYPSGDDAK